MSALSPALFLAASIRAATPLAYAALGELVAERAGVINVGLEGAIIAGAFGAVVGAQMLGGVTAGFVAGLASGVLLALIFAVFVVTLRADQIITGTALSMLGLGVTGALNVAVFGPVGAALRAPTIGPIAIPGLHALPLVGSALFDQPLPTYVLYVLIPGLAWWLSRSMGGLVLRATGERAETVRAVGISPNRVRWAAMLFGGAMGGMAGATLALAQAGTFVDGMSAGRGYVAIAIVVLGRWSPLGTAAAALLFGAASALQFLAQATGSTLPYELSLAIPYVLALVALASFRGRGAAPAMLGSPLEHHDGLP